MISDATNAMLNAMTASTGGPGICTNPRVAPARVMLLFHAPLVPQRASVKQRALRCGENATLRCVLGMGRKLLPRISRKASNCASESSAGSFSTIHVTIGVQGAVVSEPD
jgi:hypothetical protein